MKLQSVVLHFLGIHATRQLEPGLLCGLVHSDFACAGLLQRQQQLTQLCSSGHPVMVLHSCIILGTFHFGQTLGNSRCADFNYLYWDCLGGCAFYVLLLQPLS